MAETSIINRLRHKRGFGVHSPLAFMLIRDVVYPPRGYGYYVEDEIDAMCDNRSDRRFLCLGVRLAGRLQPKAVCCMSEKWEPVLTAGRRTADPADADVVIDPHGRLSMTEITESLLSRHCEMTILTRHFPSSYCRGITSSHKDCLVLHGSYFTLICRRPGLSAVNISLP